MKRNPNLVGLFSGDSMNLDSIERNAKAFWFYYDVLSG